MEVLHGSVPKQNVEECSITCVGVTNGVWHDQQELAVNSPALWTLTDFYDRSPEHEISLKYDYISSKSLILKVTLLSLSSKKGEKSCNFSMPYVCLHTCNFYK